MVRFVIVVIVVIISIIIVIRESGDPPSIFSVRNVEDMYLKLEHRYMLFLTENYAALDIFKNPKNYLSGVIEHPAVQEENSIDPATRADIQPFILFGSSFPKDKEYTQV